MKSVADLVNKECRMDMLHGYMNLSRFMVYAESIKESKLCMICRNLKRSGPIYQNQPRFKKRDKIQYEPRYHKFKLEKSSGSQGGKPTCATFRKKYYGKCLVGT